MVSLQESSIASPIAKDLSVIEGHTVVLQPSSTNLINLFPYFSYISVGCKWNETRMRL